MYWLQYKSSQTLRAEVKSSPKMPKLDLGEHRSPDLISSRLRKSILIKKIEEDAMRGLSSPDYSPLPTTYSIPSKLLKTPQQQQQQQQQDIEPDLSYDVSFHSTPVSSNRRPQKSSEKTKSDVPANAKLRVNQFQKNDLATKFTAASGLISCTDKPTTGIKGACCKKVRKQPGPVEECRSLRHDKNSDLEQPPIVGPKRRPHRTPSNEKVAEVEGREEEPEAQDDDLDLFLAELDSWEKVKASAEAIENIGEARGEMNLQRSNEKILGPLPDQEKRQLRKLPKRPNYNETSFATLPSSVDVTIPKKKRKETTAKMEELKRKKIVVTPAALGEREFFTQDKIQLMTDPDLNDEEGSTEWLRQLGRRQVCPNDTFYFLSKTDGLHLVYFLLQQQ